MTRSPVEDEWKREIEQAVAVVVVVMMPLKNWLPLVECAMWWQAISFI